MVFRVFVALGAIATPITGTGRPLVGSTIFAAGVTLEPHLA
jgi:hypothetical protein